MARRKVGSVTLVGHDDEGTSIYKVQVQVGNRNNRSQACVYVHGSERDADLAAAALRGRLLNKSVDIPDMTLSEYFNSIFVPNFKEKIEKGERAKETLLGYQKTFRKWIEPFDGSLMVNKIDEADVTAAVNRSSAQVGTRKTYSAILNAAYSDRLRTNPIFLKHVETKRSFSVKKQPWSVSEAFQAASKLKGKELVELVFLLGMCGARKEEILALRPRDLHVIKRNGTDSAEDIIVLHIDAAYTDVDGLKVTKTSDSRRYAPIVSCFQKRLLELVRETAPKIEMVSDDMAIIAFFSGWKSEASPEWKSILVENKDQLEETLEQIKAVARKSTNKMFARSPEVIPVNEERQIVRYSIGYKSHLVKKYSKTIFEGERSEAETWANEKWRSSRIIPCSADYLLRAWKSSLERLNLRYIPPSELRHTSESLHAAADVPTTSISKLHGHKTFSTDYVHYIDATTNMIVDAAEKIESYLKDRSMSEVQTIVPLDL